MLSCIYSAPDWQAARKASLLTILAVIFLSSHSTFADGSSSDERGSLAFFYASSYTSSQLEWATQFKAVNTHDFLPPEQVTYLREHDVTLISYEWLVAFWIAPWTPEDSWQRRLKADHPEWLLNTEPLPELDRAYFYDIANTDLVDFYVGRIIDSAKNHRYGGVFFDTTDFKYAVPKSAQKIFEERYHRPFLEAYAEWMKLFMSRLRSRAPKDFMIITNQGFFQHETYLPFVDYDITESWMTSYEGPSVNVNTPQGLEVKQETGYRPWDDRTDPWKSTRFVIDELIRKPVRENGYDTKFLHLNYGHDFSVPDEPYDRREFDKQSMFYGIAAAAIFGHESYFYPKNHDELPAGTHFHVDLGKPISEIDRGDSDEIAFRKFEKGGVVINGSRNAIEVDLRDILPSGSEQAFDLFTGETIILSETATVEIPPAIYPISGRKEPSGRVFIVNSR